MGLVAAATTVLADGAAVGKVSAWLKRPLTPPALMLDFGRIARPELPQLASKRAAKAAAMGRSREIMVLGKRMRPRNGVEVPRLLESRDGSGNLKNRVLEKNFRVGIQIVCFQ